MKAKFLGKKRNWKEFFVVDNKNKDEIFKDAPLNVQCAYVNTFTDSANESAIKFL